MGYVEPVAFISSFHEKQNIMAASFNMFSSITPFTISIAIQKKHYTHFQIEKSNEFVIAFPSEGQESLIRTCSSVSGWQVDKSQFFNMSSAKYVKTQLVNNCVVNLECKVVNKLDTGSHTIFIGEVVAMYETIGKRLYHRGGDIYATC